MATLSISKAWAETAEFLKRDSGPLFTLSFALVALPSVALRALAPPMVAGQPPQMGLWLLLFPLTIALSILGTLSIAVLALGRERVIGPALGYAARRLPSLLGISLLLLALALILATAVIAGAGGAPNDPPVLPVLLLGLLFLAISVRLVLMTPAAAGEALGPLGLLRRSWALTAGHFWKLLGLILLAVVVFLVILFAVSALVGIVIVVTLGAPQPGSLAALLILLVGGLLNAGFVMVFTILTSRVYAQLAGEGAATTGT